MKKLLSLTLVCAMCLSILLTAAPVASAEDTSYTYSFTAGGNAADKVAYSGTGADFKYKGMGGALATAYATTPTLATYKSQGLHIQRAGWVALNIRVPSPGLYSVSFHVLKAKSYKNGSMYILPANEVEANYTAEKYKAVDIQYTLPSTYEENIEYTDIPTDVLLKVTEENQEFILVITATGGLSAKTCTLTRVEESGFTLSADTPTIGIGETTRVSVSHPEGTILPTFATSYESSNDSVIVSEDGTITGKNYGVAVVTATIGNNTASTTIEVREKFNFRADDKTIISNKAISQYDTYEKTGRNWRYFGMRQDLYEAHITTPSRARTTTYGFQIQPTAEGQYIQLELDFTGSGIFNTTFEHLSGPGGSKTPAKVFIAPAEASSYISNNTYLGSVVMNAKENTYDVPDELSAIYIPKAGKYIFTLQVAGTAYPSALYFKPIGSPVLSARIDGSTSIKIGDERKVSAVVTADGTEKDISGVTWTSTNESVATVKNGVVTALSEGDAIIKVTAGDITDAIPVTVYHPNGKVEAATTAKVYITATDDIELENVLGTVQKSQLDIAVNTPISATAPKSVGDKEFKYWKNLSSGAVYSTENTVSFKVASNISLMAVYAEKSSGYLVEFANANRAIIKSEYLASGTPVQAPDLPYLTGFGRASGWSEYPEVVGNSDIQVVAKYDAPKVVSITVVGGTSDKAIYNYDELVTVVADAAPEGKVFSHWTRGNQIVSYSPTYTFYAWADATLTANYDVSALSNFPAVIIDEEIRNDSVNDDNNTAYMMELVGFDGKVILERGLLFGAPGLDLHGGALYKATSVLGAKQFTAMAPDASTTAVRAYVVYIDNGVIRIAYSAEK